MFSQNRKEVKLGNFRINLVWSLKIHLGYVMLSHFWQYYISSFYIFSPLHLTIVLWNPFCINFSMCKMIFLCHLKSLQNARFEKLELRRSSGLAKFLGAVIAVTGAFIITLYQGPELLMASSTYSSPTPHRVLDSQQSKWVIGGFLLLLTALSSATWNISQVKESFRKLLTFEHQNSLGLPYDEFTPNILGYCVGSILSKFQSSKVMYSFNLKHIGKLVSDSLFANLCWVTTIYFWVGLYF